jgi:hypothetical protein
VAQKLGSAASVVTLMIDSGLKYLSTDLYRTDSSAQYSINPFGARETS